MRPFFILLYLWITLGCTLNIQAQQETHEYIAFFDKENNNVAEDHSLVYFYRIFESDDPKNLTLNGRVVDYYVKDKQIKMSGYYYLNQKHGKFIFFYENGQIEQTGFYHQNKKNGKWVSFYPNGKPKSTIDYSDNRCSLISFYDLQGNKLLDNGSGAWLLDFEDQYGNQLRLRANFINGKRTGRWLYYNQNEKPLIEENYKADVFIAGKDLREEVDNSELKTETPYQYESKLVALNRIDNFMMRKRLNQEELFVYRGKDNKSLEAYNASRTFEPARPSSGMQVLENYIRAELKYPRQARKKGITGKVELLLIIEENGYMSDVIVSKSLEEHCDREAVRVLSAFNDKWIPAKQDNMATSSELKINVYFGNQK
ncbi:MAG: TonB family protein [Bernardetiaceae bacterium]|nr:TonB family protein [Bernardetiaceae bacterium]